MLKLATKFRPGPDQFRMAFEAGFRHAEFFLDRGVLEDVNSVIDHADKWDMSYALHFPNKPDLTDHHLKECARLFRAVNASAMVMHPPMIRRFEERLARIDSGLILAIETMRIPQNEIVDWVGARKHVTLDVEHIWQFSLPGASLQEFLELLSAIFDHHADCVKHVHMPGYLPGHGEHRPMYTSREFCHGVFDLLAKHNFQGLVVSEVDMQFQNPYDLQMDVLLYQGWLAERGQPVVCQVEKSHDLVCHEQHSA